MNLTIKELLDYTDEERAKWRRWFGEHGGEPLKTVLVGEVHRSVGALILHAFWAEMFYARWMRGETLTEESEVVKQNKDLSPEDVDQLFDFGLRAREEMRAFADASGRRSGSRFTRSSRAASTCAGRRASSSRTSSCMRLDTGRRWPSSSDRTDSPRRAITTCASASRSARCLKESALEVKNDETDADFVRRRRAAFVGRRRLAQGRGGGAGVNNWPSFRGEHAAGVAEGQNLPERWDAARARTSNGRRAIPGLAHSSPIVWGDRVFVTTAVSSRGARPFSPGLYGDGTASEDRSPHQWKVYALDRRPAKSSGSARPTRACRARSGTSRPPTPTRRRPPTAATSSPSSARRGSTPTT